MDPQTIATQFLNAYYKTFTEARQQLQAYYNPESELSWEKTEFKGAVAIAEKHASISAKEIQYQHVEHVCQVLPGDMILLLVNGQMSIDRAPPLGFSHVFVLQRTTTGSWFIRNEIFKFVFGAN